MTNQEREMVLAKLRRPIHIGYISKYILRKSLQETKIEINQLIDEGVVEESGYAKEYYVIKKQNYNENKS